MIFPVHPRDIRFWIAVAVLIAASAAFAVIADSVMTTAPILKQDMQVSVWLHTRNTPLFMALLLAITDLHSPVGMSILSAIVAIALWRSQHRYWLLSLLLAVPGGMIINTAIKYVVHRSRPVFDDPVLTLTSASFPSGHTAGATLFYGFLAAFMAYNMKNAWARALAILACGFMVAVVGFSRIYLGAHYLSDVLAAMSMSTAWLVLCLLFARALAQHRGDA